MTFSYKLISTKTIEKPQEITKLSPETAINKSNMDLNTRPQDDFYRYANGAWMDKAKLPTGY